MSSLPSSIRVSGNTAVSLPDLEVLLGGGISNSGTLTLTNSTVSGNMVGGNLPDGGGISNVGTMTLINSIVSGNSASDSSNAAAGGGISQQRWHH